MSKHIEIMEPMLVGKIKETTQTKTVSSPQYPAKEDDTQILEKHHIIQKLSQLYPDIIKDNNAS